MPEALEIVLIAGDLPTDIYLDFVKAETNKVLEPRVKAALARGETLHFTTDTGARYMLRNVKLEQLLKMDHDKTVCLEILYRPGVSDDQRRMALRELAKLDKKPELKPTAERGSPASTDWQAAAANSPKATSRSFSDLIRSA